MDDDDAGRMAVQFRRADKRVVGSQLEKLPSAETQEVPTVDMTDSLQASTRRR